MQDKQKIKHVVKATTKVKKDSSEYGERLATHCPTKLNRARFLSRANELKVESIWTGLDKGEYFLQANTALNIE